MILLTGASGFIGSHLIDRAADSFQFRCLVRPGSAFKIPKSQSVQIVQGDLLSPRDVERAVSGVETVVHLAASLRRSKPSDIVRVNLEGTRLLIDAARRKNVRRFVFVSSENAGREDLDDAYANSKRAAEKDVRYFENSIILRPCFVYGPGDTHGLGKLLGLARSTRLRPVFMGLTCKIQPLYIDDMVEYLIRAMRTGLKGLYLLAGPELIGLNDFLKRACAFVCPRHFPLPLPYSALRAAAFLADRLSPSSGWGAAQMKNLYGSRTYSIEKTVGDFAHTPMNIEQGLRRWLVESPKTP